MIEDLIDPKLRKKIMETALPLVKFIATTHMPFSHKKVTSKHYYEAKSKLRSGDVILTRVQGELTNLFITGYWTHAAFFYRNVKETVSERVIEATTKGVVKSDLIALLTTKDAFVILRPKEEFLLKSEILVNLLIEKAESLVGKPYDYFLLSNNSSYYCSEIICNIYDVLLHLLKDGEVVSPQDLYDELVGEFFEVVHEFIPD